MNGPLISVVIPSYKRKESVKKALLSLLSQTYSNIEIILVDDNIDKSFSDYLVLIIHELNDNRIRYIKNDHNCGAAISRNNGIINANGKYVAFLDDDDTYFPNNIEKKYKRFINSKEKNLGMVYAWVDCKDEQGNYLCSYKYKYHGKPLYKAMYKCIAATSQWLCLKSALIDAGMFGTIASNEDWQLICKILIAGYSIDYVPFVLSNYYETNGERMSMGNERNIRGLSELQQWFSSYSKLIKNYQYQMVNANVGLQIIDLAEKNNDIKTLEKEKAILNNSKAVQFLELKSLTYKNARKLKHFISRN